MSVGLRERVARRPSMARSDRADWVRERGVYLALAVLVLFDVFFTKNFRTVGTVETLLAQLPVVLIVSVGMALVIGTGGIDLSVGATMALSSAILGISISPSSRGGYTLPLGVAILLAILAGLVVGLVNGFVIGVLGVQPIVATLAQLVAVRGIALTFTHGALLELFDKNLTKLGRNKVPTPFVQVPYVMVIALVLAILASILVRRTAFGYRLLAIGGNLRAAALAGVPVRRTVITVYALSGVMAAIAGVVATARSRSADPSYVGLYYELDAITAVVVGGTALTGGRVKILGTMVGAILMLLLATTLVRHDVSPFLTKVIQAVIILAAVFVQLTNRSTE